MENPIPLRIEDPISATIQQNYRMETSTLIDINVEEIDADESETELPYQSNDPAAYLFSLGWLNMACVSCLCLAETSSQIQQKKAKCVNELQNPYSSLNYNKVPANQQLGGLRDPS